MSGNWWRAPNSGGSYFMLDAQGNKITSVTPEELLAFESRHHDTLRGTKLTARLDALVAERGNERVAERAGELDDQALIPDPVVPLVVGVIGPDGRV